MLYYSAVFISTVFSIALFYLPLHNLWFYYLSYIPSSYFSLCSYHYSGRLLGFVIVWFVFFSINALSLFIFPSVFLSLLPVFAVSSVFRSSTTCFVFFINFYPPLPFTAFINAYCIPICGVCPSRRFTTNDRTCRNGCR